MKSQPIINNINQIDDHMATPTPQAPYASINHQDTNGNTALITACSRSLSDSNARVLQLIQQGADLNIQNRDGDTALTLACLNGLRDVIETLVKHGAMLDIQNYRSHTALKIVCLTHNVRAVKLLLEYKADLNTLDLRGCTPLMRVIEENHIDIAEILIRAGADLDVQAREPEFYSETALLCCFRKGLESTMKLMLEHGADIDEVLRVGGLYGKATREILRIWQRDDLIAYAEKCKLDRYLKGLPGEGVVGDLGFGL